ncbi:hypothetical protein AOLI_G00197380 [Acnodon oligacanthus]
MFYGFLHLSSAVLLRWRCRVLQGLSRNAVKAAGLEAYRQIQNIGLFLHLCWLLVCLTFFCFFFVHVALRLFLPPNLPFSTRLLLSSLSRLTLLLLSLALSVCVVLTDSAAPEPEAAHCSCCPLRGSTRNVVECQCDGIFYTLTFMTSRPAAFSPVTSESNFKQHSTVCYAP